MSAAKKNMVFLRLFIGKLQKGLSSFSSKETEHHHKDVKATLMVPDDVKEGQFAVLAIKGDEIRRFVLELSFLNNPAFVKLLKLAEEEFGFRHKGALAVPCRPEELQKILGAGGRREMIDYCAQEWTTDVY
ncbi:auxin-responsive protein SAUR50 [Manihot esculenta]|uniref:SAUR family protein n=1 Tax=Manihot esculenta TaxID=3983 RepID=A0A2C9VCJ6_MANES|nr:auxin-responsive protein SAUR50 [Manihot esculenta]OAY42715.1 hypothetical protein MANES_08G010200v8 [Manihot esculenta]